MRREIPPSCLPILRPQPDCAPPFRYCGGRQPGVLSHRLKKKPLVFGLEGYRCISWGVPCCRTHTARQRQRQAALVAAAAAVAKLRRLIAAAAAAAVVARRLRRVRGGLTAETFTSRITRADRLPQTGFHVVLSFRISQEKSAKQQCCCRCCCRC